jgi:WD40 repeat protein
LPTVLGGYQTWWSPSLRLFRRLDKSVHSLSFSPDDSKILSGGKRTKASGGEIDDLGPPGIRIWDVAAGTEAVPFVQVDGASFVDFSPDGSRVRSASEEGTVLTIDAATGKEIESQLRWAEWSADLKPTTVDDEAAPHAISSLADLFQQAKEASMDPKALRAMDHMHLDKMHDRANTLDGTRFKALIDAKIDSEKPPKPLERAGFSPDGSVVVFGDKEGTLYVVDLEKRKLRRQLPSLAPIDSQEDLCRRFRSIAFSMDGSEFAVGDSEGNIYVIDPTNGEQKETLRGHSKEITVLAYTDDGLLSSGEDRTIRLWDTATGKEKRKAEISGVDDYQPLAISPKGKKIASTTEDGTVYIWDAESGEKFGPVLQDHFNQVSAIGFSKSDSASRIVTAAFLNQIQVWDINTSRHDLKVQRHIRPPPFIEFSDDGLVVMSWRADEMKFWATNSGKELKMEPFTLDAEFADKGCSVVSSSGSEIALLDQDTSLAWQKPTDPELCASLAREESSSNNLEDTPNGIVKEGKIIWRLPLEFKHRCIAIRNNFLAFGMWNCRVVIVRLPV